jgi:hypothetical protein
MLERKKQLKQIEVTHTGNSRLLIYEHEKSGEVYIVKDPQLKLDEVDVVQQEVSDLLGGKKDPPAEVAGSDQPCTDTDGANVDGADTDSPGANDTAQDA